MIYKITFYGYVANFIMESHFEKIVNYKNPEPLIYQLLKGLKYVISMYEYTEYTCAPKYKLKYKLKLEKMEGDLVQLRSLGILTNENLYNLYKEAHLGLAEIHKRGVAHQDVSLGNILYSRNADGRFVYKYADFGMSCSENIGKRYNKTLIECQMMDVWDLNASLYELLPNYNYIEDLLDMNEVNSVVSKHPQEEDPHLDFIIKNMRFIFSKRGKISSEEVLKLGL